jgi:hypothetical protein
MPTPSFKYGVAGVAELKKAYFDKYYPGKDTSILGSEFTTASRSVQSCGLYEIGAANFYYSVKNFTGNRLRLLENLLISTGLQSAGIVITVAENQANYQTINKLLEDLIGKPLDLGLNRNHGPWNKMWIYAVSIDEIEKRIEEEKAKPVTNAPAVQTYQF